MSDLPGQFVVHRYLDFPDTLTDEQWADFWKSACEHHLDWLVKHPTEETE